MPGSKTSAAPSASTARTERLKIVGAIPARYASSRLPGKPLAKLAGRPMIEHVYRRCQQAKTLDHVVVLTDDRRILDCVRGFGGTAEMTSEDCTSGSDRIAEAAERWPFEQCAVVNIQGDEPLIEPRSIDLVAEALAQGPVDEIVTLATPATSEEHQDPHVVKTVLDLAGRALYFSRAAIPSLRRLASDGLRPLKHLGIYGYHRSTLLRFTALEPSPLETAESLEQLRALENGIPIRVIEVEAAEAGVDTPSDIARVEALLRQPE